MKHVIDLFSGFGGWTEAFIDDPTWKVDRYDNNSWLVDTPDTHILDLSKYKVMTAYRPKLVTASPPCDGFSLAFGAKRAKAMREGKEYNPDMSLVEAAIDNIQSLDPEYWVLENVIGSISYIEPLLGPPRQIIGPFVLWGNFPLFSLSKAAMDEIKIHKKKEGDKHRWSEMRANYRAKVPLHMSRHLKLNMDAPSLRDFV